MSENVDEYKKSWAVRPGDGVGPLTFGMRKDELEGVLGKCGHIFRRGPFAERDTFVFGSVFALMDGDQGSILYHVFPPITVTLNGTVLLGRPLRAVVEDLSGKYSFAETDTGAWCESLRLSLVEVEGLVDSVELFSMSTDDFM